MTDAFTETLTQAGDPLSHEQKLRKKAEEKAYEALQSNPSANLQNLKRFFYRALSRHEALDTLPSFKKEEYLRKLWNQYN